MTAELLVITVRPCVLKTIRVERQKTLEARMILAKYALCRNSKMSILRRRVGESKVVFQKNMNDCEVQFMEDSVLCVI